MIMRYLWILFLLAGLSLGSYVFVLKNAPRSNPQQEPERPFAMLPTCDEGDLAISLLESDIPICKSNESLYVLHAGKREKIGSVKKSDTLLPGSFGYYLLIHDNTVTLNRVVQPWQIIAIFEFAINDQINPVSSFFTLTRDKLFVYISAQKEAQSPTDDKSIYYRIALSPPTGNPPSPTPLLSTFTTKEMLRIVDVYYEGKLLYLRELHPFLEEKHRIVTWEESAKIINPPYAPKTFLISTTVPTFGTDERAKAKLITLTEEGKAISSREINKNELPFIVDLNGYMSLNRELGDLTWHTVPEVPQSTDILLPYLESTDLELTARYSTRIGKRVYNCFDFSESLQITLRTCIPQS